MLEALMQFRGKYAWRALLGCTCALAALSGCGSQPALRPVVRYETLPSKQVPAFLQGTIIERTDLLNTEPFGVSAYGLVANLRGTGGSRAPTAVREYMIREMVKHGFGQR